MAPVGPIPSMADAALKDLIETSLNEVGSVAVWPAVGVFCGGWIG